MLQLNIDTRFAVLRRCTGSFLLIGELNTLITVRFYWSGSLSKDSSNNYQGKKMHVRIAHTAQVRVGGRKACLEFRALTIAQLQKTRGSKNEERLVCCDFRIRIDCSPACTRYARETCCGYWVFGCFDTKSGTVRILALRGATCPGCWIDLFGRFLCFSVLQI